MADITSNLLGWWKLDEGAGASASDSSGNGNTGTLTNGPTYVTGKVGPYAVNFTGASNQNVFVNSGLGLTGNTNLTLAGWAYRANTGDHGAFIKIGNIADGFAIGISNGGSTGFETAGNTLTVLFEAIRWIPTPQNFGTGWHHFAVVIDALGRPTVYYDANDVYNDIVGAGASIGSAGAASTNIAGYLSGVPSNRFYTGYLDDVRIYGRALTAEDITALYNYTEITMNNTGILSIL